jgi:endo-1,4-beta-xylanase
MLNHVTKVAQNYAGRIYAWDVVNEAFADGNSGAARDSNLQRTGNDWIEAAFRAAAPPTRRQALLQRLQHRQLERGQDAGRLHMVRDFKTRGVPIDCVGLQSHFTAAPRTRQLPHHAVQLRGLGVDVHITELDITNANATAYANVVNDCLAVARCMGITVWGVRDSDSWRSGDLPCCSTGSGSKKAAYNSVLTALNNGTRRRRVQHHHTTTTRRRLHAPPSHPGTVWGDRYNTSSPSTAPPPGPSSSPSPHPNACPPSGPAPPAGTAPDTS